MDKHDIRSGIEFMVKVIEQLCARSHVPVPRNAKVMVDAAGPNYARLKFENAELHLYRGLSEEQLHGANERFAQWMLFPYVAERQDGVSYIFITKAPKKHLFFAEDEITH